MIQRHTILINLTFSANTGTTVVDSNLEEVNGYQITNLQGLGGGITNPDNVRGFLNDEANQRIINDFFSYLTGSTTTVEFAEIFNSDANLSSVFNNYYESSVISNQIPSTSAIDGSLTGTTGINILDSGIHNLDGVAPSKELNWVPLSIDNSTRILNSYSALTTFTNEESYYIPVFIRRTHNQMDREKIFFEETIKTIIEQGGTGGGTQIIGSAPFTSPPEDDSEDEAGDDFESAPFTPPPGFFDEDSESAPSDSGDSESAPNDGDGGIDSGTIDSGGFGASDEGGSGKSPGESGLGSVSFDGGG